MLSISKLSYRENLLIYEKKNKNEHDNVDWYVNDQNKNAKERLSNSNIAFKGYNNKK